MTAASGMIIQSSPEPNGKDIAEKKAQQIGLIAFFEIHQHNAQRKARCKKYSDERIWRNIGFLFEKIDRH